MRIIFTYKLLQYEELSMNTVEEKGVQKAGAFQECALNGQKW